jgi:molybdopterin-guanine dinucleotide biosynthesis protein A
MSTPTKPTGLLLAGGQSRRMQGAFPDGPKDKALLDIGGKPMLVHVIERLAPQVGDLVLSANGDPARFASFGLPVVSDTIEDFAGPLAGLLAGMRWSQRKSPGTTHIVSVSTDAPFLPADLVVQFQSAVRDHEMAVAIARCGTQLHSVIGLWPVALADQLEAALVSGLRKVSAWTDRCETVVVDYAPVEMNGRKVDPFFNANTPEELATARQLLAPAGGETGNIS